MSLDPLCDVFLSDSRAAERGLEQGRDEAKTKEALEGTLLGLQKGHQLGQEVGFYLGFAEAWLRVLNAKDKLPKQEERAVKSLVKLQSLGESFPLVNVQESNLMESLEDMRARFKLCCQLLQVKQSQEEAASGTAATGMTW